jgi:hypothetical protein
MNLVIGSLCQESYVEIFPNWKNIQVHHPDSTEKFIISPLLARQHVIIPLLNPMNVHNKTVKKGSRILKK